MMAEEICKCMPLQYFFRRIGLGANMSNHFRKIWILQFMTANDYALRRRDVLINLACHACLF